MLDAIPVSVCRLLVETLGYSLWQACLIAVACWLALRMLSARRTNLRYAISCCGLLAIVGASLVTLSLLEIGAVENVAVNNPRQTETAGLAISPRVTDASLNQEVITPAENSSDPEIVDRAAVQELVKFHAGRGRNSVSEGTDWLLHLLSLIWVTGALVMLVRVVRSVLQIRRLGAESESGHVTSDLLDRIHAVVADVSRRLGLRSTVKVLVSSRVQFPGVVGTFWPILLLPPALVTGVPLEQLRIVIAHELAHVRRYDFLVNLAQMVIEALLFFNPAVWWMSRQIRIEREACCDAMAVAATGEAIPVARALVEVVARLRESLGESAANGFALAAGVQQLAEDPRQESSLLDRVRRIIVPEQRPHVRLPWYSLFGFLVAFVAVSAGLYEGADATVKAVQRALTAKERVEVLARLKAENTAVFVPPAGGVEPAITKPGEEAVQPDQQKVTVHVTVRTEDGAPIPKQLQLSGFYQTGHSSTSTSLKTPKEDTTEFKTTWKLPACKFRIGAQAPGFATMSTEPATVFLTDGDRNIEVVLTRGFSSAIQLLDADGSPIAGARVKSLGKMGFGNGWSTLGMAEFTSDQGGLVQIHQVSGMDHEVEVRAPGFEHSQQTIRFSAGKTIDWRLKSATPTSLQLVDSASGKAVSGAKAVIFSRGIDNPSHSGGHSYGDPRTTTFTSSDWRVFGTSNSEGLLSLDELNKGTRYVFAIIADGHGTKYISEVRPGDGDAIIELQPPINLSGQLTGELDRLSKERRGKSGYRLQYRNDVTFGNRRHIHSHLYYATADIEGHFELKDVVPGKVQLFLPDGTQTIAVDGSRSDLSFVLINEVATSSDAGSEAAPASKKREVILRLAGATADAPARGFLYVSWQTPTESQNGPLPIVNNEVRLQVPLSTDVSFWDRDIVGYRVTVDRKPVKVVRGDGAQVINIPAQLAGGVHGTVVRPDGTPATNADVVAFAVELPEKAETNRDVNPGSRSHKASFFRTLPFGGKYVMLARENRNGTMSWAVSAPFVIDDENPIQEIELRMLPGRRQAVQVLGSDGKPLENVSVQLHIRVFRSGTEDGFIFSLETTTGGFGIATFAESLPTEDSPFVKIEPALSVTGPAGHVGFTGKLSELSQVSPTMFELQLNKGVSASGTIVDAQTGRPVPNARIRIYPANFAAANFKENIRTRSDARGEFRFDSLEPMKYGVNIEEAMPKGTVIIPTGGGYSFRYPNGANHLSLIGGSIDPVFWEVELYPGGSLRPAPE
jgi:beta-lactamase regulating signal transducer with metallopeptidase domain